LYINVEIEIKIHFSISLVSEIPPAAV